MWVSNTCNESMTAQSAKQKSVQISKSKQAKKSALVLKSMLTCILIFKIYFNLSLSIFTRKIVNLFCLHQKAYEGVSRSIRIVSFMEEL